MCVCVCVCVCVYMCVCVKRGWAVNDKKEMTNTGSIRCDRNAGQPEELTEGTESNHRFT